MTAVPTGSTGLDEAPSRRRRRAILGVLCLSVLLSVMENTLLNIALPSIRADLGASTSQLQWITDAYVLVFAGFLLVGGSLGDRYGRKGALSAGLAIFGVFSLVAPLATSAGQLVALRALMGLGGALVFPATLSILVNVFTDPVERGRAIAIWGTTAGVGAAAGPIFGGWLLDRFYWGSVFLVGAAIVAVALVAGRILPTSRDPQPRPLDVPGAALSVALLVSLVWSIIEGQEGWGRPPVVGGFVLAALLLVAFVATELRVAHPMLELDVFRNPRFSAASFAVTACFLVLNGTLFLATQYLQSVQGLTPLQTGLRFLPGALAMMVMAQLGARLVERLGTKIVIVAGFAICATGLLALGALEADSTTATVVAAITVFYAGLQFISAPGAASIMGAVPPERAGVGSAVNDTTRQVGAALGIAVFGTILSAAYRSRVTGYVNGHGLGPAADAAQENVGAALDIAGRIGDDGGAGLAHAARDAFITGMGHAMTVGVVIFVIAAVATALTLPGRPSDTSLT